MGFKRLFAIFLVAAVFPSFAFAAVADEVKAMLEQGKAKEAYELASQHTELLGDPTFDFYYGVSAIDSGHAGEGVLALERYVINYPNNTSARLELARGYYVLGEDSRAGEEFRGVLKTNPPPDVETNILRYLDAIRAREWRYKTSGTAFVEAGFGYDSNVNAGVSNANISLPVFGPVTVVGPGVKQHSRFQYIAAGGQLSQPIAPGLAVFGSGSAAASFNNQASQFNQENFSVNGGLTYLQYKNLFRFSGFYSHTDLDSHSFLQSPGATAEWQYQYDELQSFNTYAQYANLDYSGADAPRSSNFYSGGLGYRKAFIASWQPLFTLEANYGRENNTENRDDLSRNIFAGRLALGVTPFPKWAVSVGGIYQKSWYLEPVPTLDTTRMDSYYSGTTAISYAFNPHLSAWVEYLYQKNNSNIALFSYTRDVVAFKLRYDFK
ncbi:MAG TPA: hypothetical protein VEG37_07055 [Burkholderiales bacterium]|nr:hypothetical protein [Burkholderiales bacterium]